MHRAIGRRVSISRSCRLHLGCPRIFDRNVTEVSLLGKRSNQNGCALIHSCRDWHMTLRRYFWSGHLRNIRALLACAALIGVVAARNVMPEFPQAPSAHSAVRANSHHDQRPRFDDSGPKWSAPVGRFIPRPAIAESSRLAPAPPLWSTLQTKGFHFNRPPPTT